MISPHVTFITNISSSSKYVSVYTSAYFESPPHPLTLQSFTIITPTCNYDLFFSVAINSGLFSAVNRYVVCKRLQANSLPLEKSPSWSIFSRFIHPITESPRSITPKHPNSRAFKKALSVFLSLAQILSSRNLRLPYGLTGVGFEKVLYNSLLERIRERSVLNSSR